jgi:GNAT superfamily N-acetyltransferase
MEPADAPELDTLMRAGGVTTETQMTAQYEHDVHASLAALHPGFFGVVATAPDMPGLVGMATAFIDEVQAEGQTYPCAYLENLKVRSDARRRGLGRQLAEWRIREARRRFGAEGIIVAGVDETNAASLATARTWASQILGPLRVVVGRTTRTAPDLAGLTVRELDGNDLDEVAEATNAFYADANLYPRQSAERLRRTLANSDPGGHLRVYRVAVTDGGLVVAGALVTQRYKLITDRIGRLPAPMAFVGRLLSLLPPDGVIRTCEVAMAWHAPGQLQSGRRLWQAILHEWHGKATHVDAVIDPRSGAAAMCRADRAPGPRLRLMAPVHSPVLLSASRPLCLWR